MIIIQKPHSPICVCINLFKEYIITNVYDNKNWKKKYMTIIWDSSTKDIVLEGSHHTLNGSVWCFVLQEDALLQLLKANIYYFTIAATMVPV